VSHELSGGKSKALRRTWRTRSFRSAAYLASSCWTVAICERAVSKTSSRRDSRASSSFSLATLFWFDRALPYAQHGAIDSEGSWHLLGYVVLLALGLELGVDVEGFLAHNLALSRARSNQGQYAGSREAPAFSMANSSSALVLISRAFSIASCSAPPHTYSVVVKYWNALMKATILRISPEPAFEAFRSLRALLTHPARGTSVTYTTASSGATYTSWSDMGLDDISDRRSAPSIATSWNYASRSSNGSLTTFVAGPCPFCACEGGGLLL
jgi:hypothetical protein